MDGAVTVGNYLYRHEAEMALSLLEASGIPGWVMADDAGGMQPHLNFGRQGVRLVTREENAEEAKAILSAPAAPPG